MLPPAGKPLTGVCVSNGVLGMYVVEAKGAALVSARNAAGPVGVGPVACQKTWSSGGY